MRRLIFRIIALIVFLTLPEAVLSVSVLPTGKAEYEFIYDRLERTDALSRDRFVFHLGPYRTSDERFDLGPFEDLRFIPSRNVELFSFVGEDFRAAREASAQGFESYRGGLAAAPINKLFIYGNFVLDERRAEDPTYAGKKWRGLAGEVEEAFGYYETGPFSLTVGRFSSFWGPRSSLVLSSRQAFDGFGYGFRWGRLVLSYRLARLDGQNPDQDTTVQFENRYFAGHRLDFIFADWLQAGLFETVIFGGPGRQVDLFYLNPIIFFHAEQLNEGMNDNTFLGFDFSLKPRYGVKLYGQLVVDDFQVEHKNQGDQEPDQLGLLAGLYLADIAPSLDFKTEYSRVDNWTFNQPYDRNRYLYRGQPIGGALGNDYDLYRASVIRWFSDELAASVNFLYTRQGEGSITDDWTTPWLLVTGDYNEPFPTGVVRKTTTAAVGAKGFVFDHFFFDVDVGVDWVRNFAHQDGDNRTLPFINLKVSSFVSTSLAVD
ncbi:MAG: capsule assembly Wzi family protein [Candidatus Zixiibacteriota bacterium]